MADFFIIKARTKYTGKVSENDRFMAGIIRTNYGLRIVPKPEAKEFLKSLCGVGCLILVVMMWVGYRSIRIYWMMRRELQSSRLYAQPENYEHNLIEAWNCLEKLAPSKMTKKQKKTYERYKLFLRAQMGSFHANELEIDKWREEGKEITAFQHLLQFFQYRLPKLYHF